LRWRCCASFYISREYLKPLHFNNLGKLLLTTSLLWFYFTFAERPDHPGTGTHRQRWIVFWTSIRQNFAPASLDDGGAGRLRNSSVLLSSKKLTSGVPDHYWTANRIVHDIVGMWLERFPSSCGARS